MRLVFGMMWLVGVLHGQEIISLTTPVTYPSVTNYQVASVGLQWSPRAQVVVNLIAPDNSVVVVTYTDLSGNPIATTLITALNKANLSTRSLKQRILDRLVADGKIAGTVAGTVP